MEDLGNAAATSAAGVRRGKVVRRGVQPDRDQTLGPSEPDGSLAAAESVSMAGRFAALVRQLVADERVYLAGVAMAAGYLVVRHMRTR